MSIFQTISDTTYTVFALRLWRIGFGIFRPGGKEGWVAVYARSKDYGTELCREYPGRFYIRVWNVALVWCLKRRVEGWVLYWPGGKWV